MTHLHPQTDKYDTPEKISDLLHSISAIQESQSQLSEKIRESSHSIEAYEAQINALREELGLKDRHTDKLAAEITYLKSKDGGRSPEDFLADLGEALEAELRSAEETLEDSRSELDSVVKRINAIESAKEAFGL